MCGWYGRQIDGRLHLCADGPARCLPGGRAGGLRIVEKPAPPPEPPLPDHGELFLVPPPLAHPDRR